MSDYRYRHHHFFLLHVYAMKRYKYQPAERHRYLRLLRP